MIVLSILRPQRSPPTSTTEVLQGHGSKRRPHDEPKQLQELPREKKTCGIWKSHPKKDP